MRAVAVFGAVILLGMTAPIAAQQSYDREAALAISQGALGKTIGNYTFRDVKGQTFNLESLRGKPLVISLIYTSCHHVCPVITANIERHVDIAQEALGEDSFSVVTIGFDWQVDTPDRMRMFASGKGIDTPNWHFLSSDEPTISAISKDLGFQFFPTAKGFDHLSQTTIVDAEGKIYRQVYGQDFDAPAFVEPLKELVFNAPQDAGIIDHWVGTFKLFCTVYDPNSGRYTFDYSIFMTILLGVICLGAILTFIVTEWRRAK
jgi:protein SCO1/2